MENQQQAPILHTEAPPRRSPHNFRNAGFAFLGYLVWYFIVMFAASFLYLIVDMRQFGVYYAVMGIVELSLIVPGVVYYLCTRSSRRFIFGNRVNFPQMVCAVLLGVVMVPALLGVTMLSQAVCVAIGINLPPTDMPAIQTIPQMLFAMLCLGVTAAVAEEPLFRGIMLNGAASAYGKRTAVLLTALLFAMGHGSLPGLPSLFIAGILLALVRWRTGSLWPAMAFHCAYNSATVLFEFVVGKLQSSGIIAVEDAAVNTGVGMYFASASLWLLIGIPFAVFAFLLYKGIGAATPQGYAWSSRPWLVQERKGWHVLIWLLGFLICAGWIGIVTITGMV